MKKYIPRQIEKTLLRVAAQFPSVVVSGPRQSGKSTLLRHLFSKKYSYATLDDPLTREKAISDPKMFIESVGEKAIIDEIQYAPQLASYIKIAIDQNRDRKGYFLLTGSQQFTMIKNLGDSLAGRIALLDLLPLSYEEKKRVGLIFGASMGQSGFLHACLKGSYPEMAINPKMDRQRWYSSYLGTYLERDVRGVYDIGNLRDFQRFIQMLASRTAQILNLSSLSGDIGVSVNTVKKWISVLEASHIIFLLSPYFESFGKRITKSPKIYFLDSGFACYLTGIADRGQLMRGPMAGALFETFCIQETVKMLVNRGVRPDIYYLRTNNGLEIDLIIRANGGRLYPFEVKMTQTPNAFMAGAFHKYKSLFPKLRIAPGRIIYLGAQNIQLSRDSWAVSFDSYMDLLLTSKNLDRYA